MDTARAAGATWPADVIHVNEDGWVLINRGRAHGVAPGLRLLVVGQGVRELHDLYADGADADAPVLRIRRTYEQLEVIHAEPRCSLAVAARIPPERRPVIHQGPQGELLVWVPLPADFTWPEPGTHDDTTPDAVPAGAAAGDASDWLQSAPPDDGTPADAESPTDTPPERGEQDDERWDHALPLNGVSVGDIVLPAIPIGGADMPGAGTSAGQPAGTTVANPFESGRSYDWMGTQSGS